MRLFTSIFIIGCLTLFGCNSLSNQKSTVYKIPETPKNVLPPLLQSQFASGVDFVASGNEIADWSLAMNFDDSIKFSAHNGLRFTIPAMRPEIKLDTSLVFTSSITLGKVVINISNGNCNNIENNKGVLSKQCSVTIGNITYTGCGQFLHDFKLDGRWNLLQYKAEKITELNFKNGIPYLKFSLENNKLSGFDGCNTITGTARLEGKRIRFSEIATTKKQCNNINLQQPFSILQNQLTGYKISGDLLYLYLIDDSVLIFQKTA